jgi:hypothetical protein
MTLFKELAVSYGQGKKRKFVEISYAARVGIHILF